MKRKNCITDDDNNDDNDDDDDFIEDEDFENDDAYIKKMKNMHDEQKKRHEEMQKTKDIAPKAIPCPIHKRNCTRRLVKDKSYFYYKCFIHGCK